MTSKLQADLCQQMMTASESIKLLKGIIKEQHKTLMALKERNDFLEKRDTSAEEFIKYLQYHDGNKDQIIQYQVQVFKSLEEDTNYAEWYAAHKWFLDSIKYNKPADV